MADQPLDPGGARDAPPGEPTGAPRWVEVFAILGAVVVLVVVIAALAGGGPGGHGPGRHFGTADVLTPLASLQPADAASSQSPPAADGPWRVPVCASSL